MQKRVSYSWLWLVCLTAALVGCAGEAASPPPGAQEAESPVPEVEMTSGGEVTN